MTAHPLRVGLIVDTPRVPEPASEWRKAFEPGDGVEVVALIVQGSERQPRGFVPALRSRVFAAMSAVESFCLRDSARRRRERATGETGFQTVLRVSNVGSSRQHGFEYSDEALDAIRRLDLDVLVHMGSGRLRGAVLTSCRYGVLSVRYGRHESDGTSPEGFWETFEGSPTTEFVIEQSTGGDGSVTCVLSGDFVTRRYFTRNREQVLSRTSLYMTEVVRQLAAHRCLPARGAAAPMSAEKRSMPSLSVQLAYGLTTVGRLALAALRFGVIGSRGEWSVGRHRHGTGHDSRESERALPRGPVRRRA